MVRMSFGTIVLLPWTLLGQMVSATVDIHPVFAKSGILAVSGIASEFPRVVAKLAGDAASKELEPLGPYVIAVQNATDQNIDTVILYCLRREAGGQTVPYTSIADLKGRPPFNFPPGSTLVFTPGSRITWDAILHRWVVPGFGTAAPFRHFLADQFSRGRFLEVSVSLDSVVLGDGSVIGPDRADFIGRERHRREIEDASLTRLLDDSISDSDISRLLRDEISAWEQHPTLIPGTGFANDEGIYRIGLDKALLRYMQAGGRLHASEWLKGVIASNASAPALHSVRE